MTCICKPCNKINIGCAAGIECHCFMGTCIRPLHASIDINFVWDCTVQSYTNDCQSIPGAGQSCLQTCPVQDLYDEFYNGTHILDKVAGSQFGGPPFCDDFLYFGSIVYPAQTQIPSFFDSFPSPFIGITAQVNRLYIEYQPVEYYPCTGPCVWCQNPLSNTIEYQRNNGTPCDATSIEYKLPTKVGYCLHLPRTITLNLIP